MWLLMIPKSCYEKSSEVMLYISSSTPFRPRLTPSTFDADVFQRIRWFEITDQRPAYNSVSRRPASGTALTANTYSFSFQ